MCHGRKKVEKHCARANGLLERSGKGKTVLGLHLALEVNVELESLNMSLQSRTETISGMRSAVECVASTLQEKMSEEAFHEVFDKVQ